MNENEQNQGREEKPVRYTDFERELKDYQECKDVYIPELIRSKQNIWQEKLDLLCVYLEPHEKDILIVVIQLLRKAGKGNRLTKDRLISLAKSEMDFIIANGPIKKALASSTFHDILNNKSQGRNRGYGLPEWEWE